MSETTRRVNQKAPADKLRPLDQDAPTISFIDPLVKNKNSAARRIALHEEIARGGMGTVIKGRDSLLNRDLAIKVLLDSLDDETAQRFYEEAQINAQLQHPGIVPVYEVGRLSDSRPYFAMKLVKGKTLRELLDARKDPEEDRQRFLGIFEQVCQTMAYAHSRQVIHRDLKPSNIMVGAFGEVQVMDWGVAKVLSNEASLDADVETASPELNESSTQTKIRTMRHSAGGRNETLDGVVLGTLAYMSPEQALDEKERVTEASDVFGLGAILCEIISGKPPYEGQTTKKLYRQAARGRMEDVWARLEECDADHDLIDLATRCLQYEPERRPENAGVLAKAMTAYFESVDNRLRQVELDRTKEAEAKKRRKVKMALVGSLSVSVLLAAFGFIWAQNKHVETEFAKRVAAETEAGKQRELASIEQKATKSAQLAQLREQELRKKSESLKQQTEWTLSDVYTDRGVTAAENGDTGSAIIWFAEAAKLAGADQTRRDNNLIRAKNWLPTTAIPVGAHNVEGRTKAIEFQPNGHLTLTHYTPLEYSFRDRPPRSEIFMNQTSSELKWLEELELPEVQATKHASLFSIFDWKKNQVVPWLESEQCRGVACWSPGGDQIAIAFANGQIQIRNAADGNVDCEIKQAGEVTALAYSRDGSQLAIASDVVQIWQVQERNFKKGIAWSHPTEVHSMSFNQDGSLIVTAALDSVARIYSTRSAYDIAQVAFDDSQTLEVKSEVLKSNDEPVFCIPHIDLYLNHLNYCKHAPSWMPVVDGCRKIVSVVGPMEIATWDVDKKTVVKRVFTAQGTIGKTMMSNDGVYACTGFSELQTRNSNTIAGIGWRAKHLRFVSAAKFNRTGDTYITGSLDATAQLWKTVDGEKIGSPLTHDSGVGAVAISDDDQWLATGTLNGLVRIWKYPTRRERKQLTNGRHTRVPTFSSDGRFVVAGKSDGANSDHKLELDELEIFDANSGELSGSMITAQGKICDACFECNNKSVIVAHNDSINPEEPLGFISTFDLSPDHELLKTIKLSALAVWVQAHPSKPVAAVMCSDSQLNVVDLEKGEVVYTRQYDSATDWYCKIRFTPDGKKIVVCGHIHFQAIDAQTGNPCFDAIEYPNSNRENCVIAISPDSNTVAVSSGESAMFWDLETGEQVGTPLFHTRTSHYLGAVASMEFSPDSKQLLTSCFDHYARLWDWKTGKQICPPMKHDDEVHCAIFTPDGKYAVTGSRGEYCGPHTWDLKTGMRIGPSWGSRRNRPIAGMHCVAMSPNGQQLFGSAHRTWEWESIYRYDFAGMRQLGKFDYQNYMRIGELISSKKLTLGRTESVPKASWLEYWSRFSKLNSRFTRTLEADRKWR